MKKTRLELSDNYMDIVMKMSEGNPGAMTALMELAGVSPTVDPQSALGILGPAISLDTHGIYGSDIYILWSDKCGRDSRRMLLLLRSVQLGFNSEAWLKSLAEDQTYSVMISDEEWESMEEKVCGQLEQFMKKPEAEKC